MPQPELSPRNDARALIALVYGVLALGACNRHGRDRVPWDPTTTLTGANVVPGSGASAVNSIVEARCTREATCNDLGAGRHFSTRGACVSILREDMREDLSASDCPGGVDPKRVDECLARIRTERCDSPVAELGRLRTCSAINLCIKADVGKR